MNIKNLKLLVARLEKQLDSPEAARFNMRQFGSRWNESSIVMSGRLPGFVPVCRTQACLAGETVLATGSGKLLPAGGIAIGESLMPGSWDIEEKAAADLDLTSKQRKKIVLL